MKVWKNKIAQSMLYLAQLLFESHPKGTKSIWQEKQCRIIIF